MTRLGVAGLALQARLKGNFGWLVMAAALAVMLTTGVPDRTWQVQQAWAVVIIVLSWLPLTVRWRWPIPVLGMALCADTVHIVLAGHAQPSASILPAATMLALFTIGSRYTAPVAWTAAVIAGIAEFSAAVTSSLGLGTDLLYLN